MDERTRQRLVLWVAVLASFVSGERVEPYPHEVIRTVGRYDHGKCVLPRGFSVQ